MGKDQSDSKEQPLVLFAGLAKGGQLIASYSQHKHYEQAAMEALKEVPPHVHRFSLGHGGVMALFRKFPDLLLPADTDDMYHGDGLTASNSCVAVLIAYESPTLMRARGFEFLNALGDIYHSLLSRPKFPLRRTASAKLEAQIKTMSAAERGVRSSQELRIHPLAPKAFLVRDQEQSAEDLAAIAAVRDEIEAKKERAKNMLEAELQFVNNMADDDIGGLVGKPHVGWSGHAAGDGNGEARVESGGAGGAAYNPSMEADSDDDEEHLVPKSMPGAFYQPDHPAASTAAAPQPAVSDARAHGSRGGSSRGLGFSLSFSHGRGKERHGVDVEELVNRVRALASGTATGTPAADPFPSSSFLSFQHSSLPHASPSPAKLQRSGSHGSRSKASGAGSRSFSFVHASAAGTGASGTLAQWLRGNRPSLLPADAARVSPASDGNGGPHSAEWTHSKQHMGQGGMEGGGCGESLEQALAKVQEHLQSKELEKQQGHTQLSSSGDEEQKTWSDGNSDQRQHGHGSPQQQAHSEASSGVPSPRVNQQGGKPSAPKVPPTTAEVIASSLRKKKNFRNNSANTSPSSVNSSSNAASRGRAGSDVGGSGGSSPSASPLKLLTPHKQASPHGQHPLPPQQQPPPRGSPSQALAAGGGSPEEVRQVQEQMEAFREEYKERERMQRRPPSAAQAQSEASSVSRKQQFDLQREKLLQELQGGHARKTARPKELPNIPPVTLMVPYPPSPITTPRSSSVLDHVWADKEKKRDKETGHTGWGFGFGWRGKEAGSSAQQKRRVRAQSTMFVSEASKRAVPVERRSQDAESVNGSRFGRASMSPPPARPSATKGRHGKEADPWTVVGNAIAGKSFIAGSKPSHHPAYDAWAAEQQDGKGGGEGGGRMKQLLGGGWRR